jgi:hypothetical protein
MMPKAILEFQLPEEETEHEDALNGTLWRSVVADLDNTLRSWIKHGLPRDITIETLDGNKHPGTFAGWLQAARDALSQAIDDHGLRLHD